MVTVRMSDVVACLNDELLGGDDEAYRPIMGLVVSDSLDGDDRLYAEDVLSIMGELTGSDY